MWSDSDEDCFHYPYYHHNYDYVDDDSEHDHELDMFDYMHAQMYGSDSTVYSPPTNDTSSRNSVDLLNHTDSEEDFSLSFQVPSLVDISSRFVALKFPFAYIEHRNPPVPDELQLKVISFSFPDNEEVVRKYAEFSRNSVDIEYARRLCKNGCVKNLTQIGFRLSAVVEDRRCCASEAGKNYVAIQFDRGKITSVQCSCTSNPQTVWCNHIIATSFERILNKSDTTKVCMRLPVSDSLNLLNREQLLKFAQYLLCEHKNEPVVDNAQQLLDKLLHPGGKQDGVDDINSVAGAPDSTAGPGMDEEAQWFISKDGLKSRFDFVTYQDLEELGFESCGKKATEEPASFALHELWRKISLHPALLKDVSPTFGRTTVGRSVGISDSICLRDEIDAQIDLVDHHAACLRSSLRGKDTIDLLKIIPDLLRDDSSSAVAALQACVDCLVLRLRRVEPPLGELGRSMPLAGGFTPRPFSCGTLVYETSRLWRIAVLNPKLSAKNRQEILEQLTKWDQEVKKSCHDKGLCVWQGLEVSVRLGQLYQQTAEVATIMKRPCLTVPAISSCMVVRYNADTESALKRKHTERESSRIQAQTSDDEEMLDMSEDLPAPRNTPGPRNTPAPRNTPGPELFFLPHDVSFGSSFTLDVHTACSLIEAMIVYDNSAAALRLAVALSASIVSFYGAAIQGELDPSNLPVSEISFIGRSTSDGQRELNVEEHAGGTTELAGVWPKDTLLTVTAFAFLYDVLLKQEEEVDAIVKEMSLDWLKSSKTLMFKLGLVGLFAPKLPAPGKQQEVEQYEHESWLTHQLINTMPSDQDKEMLSSLGHLILSSSVLWYAAPPSSLARVVFHHLFAEAPASFDVCLTTAQSLGLDVAFHLLRCVSVPDERSERWCFFHYSVCRLWSKFAEAVLRVVSDNKPLLDKAMRCILSPESILGRGAEPRKREAQNCSASFNRRTPLVEAKCRAAYGLARALVATSGTANHRSNSRQSLLGRALLNEESRRPRKKLKSGSDQALNLCAIQLGVHNLWLQKLHKQSYTRPSGVSWLTDVAVNSGKDGMKCLLECKGDVTRFFHPNESLLGFCTKLLRNEEEPQFEVVKQVFTCVLKDESSSPVDVKNTISLCSDFGVDVSSVFVPWICELLKTSRFTPKVIFHGSLNASQAMFTFFKRKLREEQDRLVQEQMEQDDEGQEAAGAEAASQYMTPKPHPYLEVAYELGLKALESLDDNLAQEIVANRMTDMQMSLREFCDVVNYIVLQSWKKDNIVCPVERPGEEGAAGPSDVQKTPSNRYLSQFVSQLINSVRNPMWLFDVLKKLCTGLCPDTISGLSLDYPERQDALIQEASSKYPLLSLVLQKNLTAFRNLLVGPQVTKLVVRHSQRMPVNALNAGYEDLDGTAFKEVLRVAKRLHLIIDSSGTSFDKLTREIESKHPVLKPVLKAARKAEKKSRLQRRDTARDVLGVAIIRRRRDPIEEFLFG